MTYINVSDVYGNRVEMTVRDYHDLNPTGAFEESRDCIIEYWQPDDDDATTTLASWGVHGLRWDERYYRIVARLKEE